MFLLLIPILGIAGWIAYSKQQAAAHAAGSPSVPQLPAAATAAAVPATATTPAIPTATAAAVASSIIQSAATDPSLQIGINPGIAATPSATQPSMQSVAVAIQLVKDQAANALLQQGNLPEATSTLLAVEALPNLF